ncbi:MAG: helix-hairpin-helix domain-containing protein [Candidatus Thorarchaeota archaeon]
MSQVKSQESIRRAPIVASLLLTILAVITWWINTVLAMVLVFSALFAFVYGVCTLPFQEVQAQTRVVRRRRMHREWDRIPLERLDLLEEQMRESLKQFEVEAEEEGFAIPVDDVESESAGLVHDIPVEVVDGIGRTFGRKLREADVSSLDDLAASDAAKIAKICSVGRPEAEAWVADAKAIVQGAGVTSILELAMSDPEELIQKVEQAVEDGFIEVPKGHEFTIWAARHWIAAANEHIVLTPEDIKRWSEDQP